MSYDHYVAICKPLHYMTIMRVESWESYPLLLGIWLLDYPSTPWPEPLPGILWLCYWPFFLWCFSNTEEFIFWYMVLRAASYILCCVNFYSDPCVYSSVLHMYHWMILSLSSAQERKKSLFSTRSSHMIVVSIINGSCIFMYVKPSDKDEVALNKGDSLLTILLPLRNKFLIYPLRNKQVKCSFYGILKIFAFHSKK